MFIGNKRRRLIRPLALLTTAALCMGIAAPLCAQDGDKAKIEKYGLIPPENTSNGTVSRTVKLFFLRDAGKVAGLLNAVFNPGSGGGGAPAAAATGTTASVNATLSNSNTTTGNVLPNSSTTTSRTTETNANKVSETVVTTNKPNASPPSEKLIVQAVGDETIVLFGPYGKVRQAHRLIAAVDLPRPGVNLDLWGVQLSSGDRNALADASVLSKRYIDSAKREVRAFFTALQGYTKDNIKGGDLDPHFLAVFTGQSEPSSKIEIDALRSLGFSDALNATRSLSMTDVLLRIVSAKQPGAKAAQIANDLLQWHRDTSEYARFGRPVDPSWSNAEKAKREKQWKKQVASTGWVPFSRFFEGRGLKLKDGVWTADKRADEFARQSRVALLKFALSYQDLIHRPTEFSPFYLQHSADLLNGRLEDSVSALSRDIRDAFVTPTLDAIKEEVRQVKNVEYSQVGNTTLSTLSGVTSNVTTTAVNAMDATPPLRLSKLLTDAKTLSDQVKGFVPTVPIEGTEDVQEAVLTGGIPVSQLIGLIGAFGEQQTVWRELAAGVSLQVTPNVLRNATSAELHMELTFGDPQAGTREEGVRPISRVSKHEAKTKVYVNALDVFEVSTFSNQSTMDGGRGYVPILGHIWSGVFSDVPVIGNLFSWKKSPQKRYHQSLVMVNSIISPTAMGVALLYPTDGGSGAPRSVEGRREQFDRQEEEVDVYLAMQEKLVEGPVDEGSYGVEMGRARERIKAAKQAQRLKESELELDAAKQRTKFVSEERDQRNKIQELRLKEQQLQADIARLQFILEEKAKRLLKDVEKPVE